MPDVHILQLCIYTTNNAQAILCVCLVRKIVMQILKSHKMITLLLISHGLHITAYVIVISQGEAAYGKSRNEIVAQTRSRRGIATS